MRWDWWVRSTIAIGCVGFVVSACRPSKGTPSGTVGAVQSVALEKLGPNARVPKVRPPPAEGIRLTFGLPAALTGPARERALAQTLQVLRRRRDALNMDAALKIANDEIVLEAAGAGELEFRRQIDELTREGRFELRRVNDELDPFVAFVDADTTALPHGVTIETESVLVGPDRYERRLFAQLHPDVGEPPREALKRFREWLASIEVAPNHEIGVGTIPLDGAHPTASEGYRSYIVSRRVELANDALANAAAQSADSGWQVSLQMTTAGGKTFEALTASLTKRRLAVVVDHLVVSAPVVMERISGGRVVITMGASPREHQRREAEGLARVLSSGALPAPLEPLSEELFGATPQPK